MSAFEHFKSKIRTNFPENGGMTFSLETNSFNSGKNSLENSSVRKGQLKQKRMVGKKGKSKIHKHSWTEMTEINKLHDEYVKKIKGNRNTISNELLYRMELTGALVEILYDNLGLKHTEKHCISVKGIVIEERMNTIVLITNSNEMKLFPKSKITIIYEFENTKYFFIGENLKKNRVLKK